MRENSKSELKEKSIEWIELSSSIEKVEKTKYEDIINIHFKSENFRPINLEKELKEWEITHISFKNKVVEYTKK